MKLSTILVTALLAGALTVIGCGDSGSSSNGGGDGGSNGGGGDPCNVGECVSNADRRQACEVSFAACSTLPVGSEARMACESAAVADQCFDQ